MADVIKKSTNKFTKGLVLDFSPENTKNEVLTHALNATLLTFNGNEMSLQNDMGNARVETAFLPEGYIPVGTCEYGGIIYIVSYNPIEDKSQIGCFPSPERNISNDELGISDALISNNMFQKIENDRLTGDLLNNTQYVLLKNDNLNPGDKFLICADEQIYEEKLSDLLQNDEFVEHPVLALNVVSIEDSGKIVYLNSDLKQYTKQYNADTYQYHILGEMAESKPQESIDIDKYRNVLSSGYSIFKSKTSGKLAILAELIMIDSYSVTHSIVPIEDNQYEIIIHTDVEPKITSENYFIAPKLKYYYLENSQGFIQKYDKTIELFNEKSINTAINDITLSDLYTNAPNTTLETSYFNFKPKGTYHTRTQSYTGDLSNNSISTTFYAGKYHRVTKNQLINENGEISNEFSQAKFYLENDLTAGYTLYTEPTLNDAYKYYLKTESYEYKNAARNEKYKNEQLYKLNSKIEYQIAKTDDIIDLEKEKFIIVQTVYYKKITKEEYDELIQSGEEVKFWKKFDNNIYESILEFEEGNTYIKEEIESFKSIGFEVNPSSYQTDIYYPITNIKYDKIIDKNIIEKYFDHKDLDFPYNENDDDFYGFTDIFYYKNISENYVEASLNDLSSYEEDPSNWNLYYKPKYIYKTKNEIQTLSNDTVLLISMSFNTNVTYNNFKPNITSNYIAGYSDSVQIYDDEAPITLTHFAEFLINDKYQYSDVVLANLALPKFVYTKNLTLPFKYDYTLVPCMNYGKLNHLAVSNTIDFSKLHDFHNSNFNVWKYYIDKNQMKLSIGAEVYDTFIDDKVNGIILEFYDMWGFAGSYEINNKKSYSGIFNKTFILGKDGELSTKKVIGNKYVESNYVHNAKIQLKDNIHYLNNYKVEHGSLGWKYKIDSPVEGIRPPSRDENRQSIVAPENTTPNIGENFNKPERISEKIEINDCGTLYSNLLYGVKLYFKQKNKITYKKTVFLFTLPLYNNYYYTHNDFNTLTNPALELMLTYKLEDGSYYEEYNTTDYVDGYNSTDKEKIEKYMSGTYDNTTLEAIKYYKFTGTSKLFLEVGLRKEYEQYNLTYDPELNTNTKCTLKLLNNENNYGYSVTSSMPGYSKEQILNHDDLPNSIKINNNDGCNIYDLRKHNFITIIGDSIDINYEFVVGFKFNINDIRKTEVPCTTVCALYHQYDASFDNMSDFGIEKQIYPEKDANGNDITYTEYLSTMMLYNTGNKTTSEFGTCKMTPKKFGNMGELVSFHPNNYQYNSYKVDVYQLNTGKPLKNIVDRIGKLTFCQPHVHMKNEDNGVNIQGRNKTANTDLYFNITKEITKLTNDQDWGESSNGTGADNILYYYPRFNLSANTKRSIKHQEEFISAIDHRIINKGYECRVGIGKNDDQYVYTENETDYHKYTGVTRDKICTFNECLLETMKSVYAYNPDYSTIPANKGIVSINNYNPTFISNIMCNEFILNDEKNFNDYIYLNNIKFSDYLTQLSTHSYIEIHYKDENSNEIILPQLKLTPNYKYCGRQDYPYLIHTLKYQIPVPQDLSSDLEFNSINLIAIKHHKYDKPYNFVKGILLKNKLYGYDAENNNLVQLDVTNYTIDESGKLSLKQDDKGDQVNINISNAPLKPNSVIKPSILMPNGYNPIGIKNQIVYSNETSNYSEYVNKKYTIKETFGNCALINTSITLNDLEYIPEESGHRLFMKSNLWKYDGDPRNILYYRKYPHGLNRTIKVGDISGVLNSSFPEDIYKDWYAGGGEDRYNRLYLVHGPCFTYTE